MGNHRTSSISFFVLVCSLLLLIAAGTQARPTTPQKAKLVVSGWLANNTQPFDMPLGNRIMDVETVAGEAGEPLYYVVRLSRSAFVIVPADDLVEPILSFAAGQPPEPSAQDPLTALITADVNARLADAYQDGSRGRLQIQSATPTQTRWHDLITKAGLTPNDISIQGMETISDVRVAPFLKTRWAQANVCRAPCYNYFTPDNYPCGCAATAMAQLLYYCRYPATGIGQQSFTISVLGEEQPASTRGGDGTGGPYRWADMSPVPDCNITAEQQQAIGALCYDAGVTMHMNYTQDGSGASSSAMASALKSTFGFSNSVSGGNHGRDMGVGLAGMINPNLDAGYPVVLGLHGKSGHAVVADGYGYDTSTPAKTLYHHLNMGWAGRDDVWYNLPEVGNHDTVPECIYNVFAEGTGEIISGRITDASGQPISGVTIRADLGTKSFQTVTNDKGIYALTKLPSASSFAVQPDKPGFTFSGQMIETGTSQDRQASAGNQWGIDFVGTAASARSPADENTSSSTIGPEGTSSETPTPAD
jgi:hypothetical protein